MRGDLMDQPFSEVLAEVDHSKGTGALLLRSSKVKKIVYFREGVPHSVKSNLLSECLGRLLVRERFISEADYQESLKRMMASGRRQGAVLVEMGCISPQNLHYALALQVRTKLLEIFTWKSGEFQFNPETPLPPEATGLEMSMVALIYEGSRLSFPEERIEEQLRTLEQQYVALSPTALEFSHRVGLGEEERQVLASIDGRKRVSELRELMILPPVDTNRLLYALKCTHLADFSDSAIAHSRFDLH